MLFGRWRLQGAVVSWWRLRSVISFFGQERHPIEVRDRLVFVTAVPGASPFVQTPSDSLSQESFASEKHLVVVCTLRGVEV
jgi:hypothetical protein